MVKTPPIRADCLICRREEGDAELHRIPVWEDARWRLTTSMYSEIPGFSYLEPKRHIPYVTELDGEEARTLGPVLARTTRALKEETGAELVYVLVFGGHIPHLHIHLSPHVQGGPPIGDLFDRLASEAPLRPEGELRSIAERVGRRLATA
jgi:diadenosine tetraphosphate (Ap4A) HIT family hydrolase